MIVKISIYNANPADTNTIKETYQDTLRIQYDTTKGKIYQAEDILKFTDAYKYMVEIVSLNNSLNRVLPVFKLRVQHISNGNTAFLKHLPVNSSGKQRIQKLPLAGVGWQPIFPELNGTTWNIYF